VTAARVDVQIEELALHGFPPLAAGRVGEAVERELSLLVAARGLPTSFRADRAAASLDGGVFPLGAAGDARGLGARIAGNVYGSLAR
jgi:hypothetical protein